jgi:subtilisin family serine protease
MASAGNDSGDARLPAAYSFVLGVAGSNIDEGLACFSNAGDVAAPSGDNGPGDDSESESPACESMVKHCAGSPEYYVVSLAMRTSPESGHAYWAGTSFAAPLASGLAALVLEAGGVEVSPDEVCGKIENGATTEYDIIDVQNLLP